MLVCALGDLALDVLVRLGGPVAPGGDVDAEIVLAPGGQAANVAAWASELGARSRFLGKLGGRAAVGGERALPVGCDERADDGAAARGRPEDLDSARGEALAREASCVVVAALPEES